MRASYLLLYFHPQLYIIVIDVVATVEVPPTASFSEDAGTVQVCVTLDRMSAVPIGVTVTAMDGKYFCMPVIRRSVISQ